MIFLDANVFLRYLAPSTSPAMDVMKQEARDLFTSVRRGERETTTSEVVIHEVCYVLQSSNQYGLDASQAVEYLQPLLGLPGMTFPGTDKEIYLQALELLLEYPKLGFADAVISVRAQTLGAELATFDAYLASMPFVRRWVPSSSSSG